ncbi:MAG: transcription termination/antitermination protein NusG [Chlamydiota bacterium]
MHKWYVVQVVSGQEKKAKKSIEEHLHQNNMVDLIEQVLVPIEKVSEVKRGEQTIREKKLWPGYILLKMTLNDDSWMYVKNALSVLDFLGGDRPAPLSEAEVSEILRDIEEKKQGVVQKHQFALGSRVKITDGVFVNFVGTITEVFHDKGRLSVLVSIFGRDTQVDDLEFWQVEEVTHEEAE